MAIKYGTAGPDRIIGTKRDDILYARDGEDTLLGVGGDDMLYGNREGEQLYGGTGDDTLIGGLGRDTMTGGDGNDVFKWLGHHTDQDGENIRGTDIITDFQLGGKSRGAFTVDMVSVDIGNTSGFDNTLHAIGAGGNAKGSLAEWGSSLSFNFAAGSRGGFDLTSVGDANPDERDQYKLYRDVNGDGATDASELVRTADLDLLDFQELVNASNNGRTDLILMIEDWTDENFHDMRVDIDISGGQVSRYDQDVIDLSAIAGLDNFGQLNIEDRQGGALVEFDGFTIGVAGVRASDLGAEHFIL